MYDVLLMALRLYAVLDPLAVIPIYLSMISGMEEDEREALLRKVMVFMALVLTLVSLSGGSILTALGVTISGFKMGGGVLLLVLAVDELGRGPRTKEVSEEEAAVLAIVPLGTPLLVGPGTLTMLLMFLIDHSPLEVTAAALLACLATYLTLRAAGWLGRVIGESGALALGRFMAIILAAYAAEMIHSALIDWGIAR